MAGMLTVVNPRRKRRRRHHVKAHSKRRRRVVRAHNPARRVRRRRRHVSHRRRRNPVSRGFNLNVSMRQFTAAVMGAGVGAVGARVISNAIKNTLFPTATPLVKIGIEAGVGLLSGVVVGGMLRQRALGAGLATGAAVVVALDLYDFYVKANMPALLQDYQYGSLSDWAPQANVSDYQTGVLSGNVYEDNVYGG